MESIKTKCICGNIMNGKAGDSIFDDSYHWSVSYYCEKCGTATEVDGLGIEELPDYVKNMMIKKFGKWAISSVNKSNKKKVKYILTKISLINNIEVCNDDSDIIITGTENEMRWIGKQLENKKISDFSIIRMR